MYLEQNHLINTTYCIKSFFSLLLWCRWYRMLILGEEMTLINDTSTTHKTVCSHVMSRAAEYTYSCLSFFILSPPPPQHTNTQTMTQSRCYVCFPTQWSLRSQDQPEYHTWPIREVTVLVVCLQMKLFIIFFNKRISFTQVHKLSHTKNMLTE